MTHPIAISRRNVAVLCVALAAVSGACAQAYPSKPVKMLVGYAPGSSTDIVGRLVATKLGELWKQTVIVENRGGAAGNLAADAVAKSTPDGYTVLFAQNGLAISVGGNPGLPFNGEKDLIPVVAVAATPHILIVAATSPYKTVKELVAAVKAKPGALSFASSGIGNSDHMAGELFNSMADLKAIHIPYRGGSLAATDTLSGQVDYYFAGMPVGLPQAKAGRARALAVTGKQRFPGAPDVPTVAEAGLPEYEAVLWQGVFLPAGTPKDVVNKIANDVNTLLDSADMKEKMAAAGVQILRSTQPEFDAYYRADIAKWARVIKASGIKLGSGSYTGPTMKIAAIEAIPVRLPMLRPMKMAGVVISAAENLLVRIESDTGLVGWGEAASAPTMTGELLEGMAAAVRYLAPFLLGQPCDDLSAVETRMGHALHGNASGKAAIDMALHDLLGKALGQPVHALLGLQRRTRVPALWMLGTGQLDSDLAEARERQADGCVAFKIKVGVGDPLADAQRTRVLCAALGRHALIGADANQGWTYAQAAAYLAALDGARLDFLEQPLAGEDLDGMRRLAASTPVAIGCDEGVHSLGDLRQHHQQRAAAGCSLKLIKLGGLQAVYRAALLCQQLEMHVNLACKVAESSIASAAVLHLAAALPSLEWGVSLSSQYLADEVVRRPLQVIAGHATVPTGPGLGVEVDEDQVAHYRIPVSG